VRRVAGLVSCLAGGVAILAVHWPWFELSVLGLTAQVPGSAPHMYGRTAVVLGALALAGGLIVVALPRRRFMRRPFAVALFAVGLAGVGVMVQQVHELSSHASAYGGDLGLSALGKLIGWHASVSWGYWLEVSAFAVVAAAAVAVWMSSGYSTRSAPPSTGMTHPVRYDAAGESTKAATWPNSSGSP
jgi:hypothetical protein